MLNFLKKIWIRNVDLFEKPVWMFGMDVNIWKFQTKSGRVADIKSDNIKEAVILE